MSKKVTNLIAGVLLIISAVIGIYTFIRCNQYNPNTDQEILMGVIEPMFTWMYILVVVAVVAIPIVAIPQMIKNPAGMKKFGIGVLAFAALFLVTYMLSSDAPLPFIEDADKKNQYSRIADLNLISMYIMSILAVVAVLYTAVKGILFPNK